LEVIAHPQDCPAVEAWLQAQAGGVHATVRADPGVTPGGCLLRADDASLDATLQTRIRRTLAAVGIDEAQARQVATLAVADASEAMLEQPPQDPAA
jgi:flagellar biosynthesis/type III secretory pathway protein FliH